MYISACIVAKQMFYFQFHISRNKFNYSNRVAQSCHFSEHIFVCSITDFSCFFSANIFLMHIIHNNLPHRPVPLTHIRHTYHKHAEVWGMPCHSKHCRFEVFLVPSQIDEGNHLQRNNLPTNILANIKCISRHKLHPTVSALAEDLLSFHKFAVKI